MNLDRESLGPAGDDSADRQPAAGSRPASRDRWFAAAALALSSAHFASFFDRQLPIFTDIRYFLYFAWRMAEGAVPHLDLFDNKTFGSNGVAALFYRAGNWLGVDELSAIRAGCLAVCALGGMLIFLVFRRIGEGSQTVGLLGLLGYLSFGFIGALPAIGNFPKLFMPYLAALAALLVFQRRWFWAGLMGALAFMDWQVGALVGVAAVLAALLEKHGRWRSAALVVAGGVAGLIPVLIYYLWNGALDVALEQIIMASIARSEESLANHTVWTRMTKMWLLAGRHCPEQRFLFVTALAGLAVVPVWWWRHRGAPASRLVYPLALYHYSVLAFSLLDFQRFGDFYLVLQSLAFFLGMTWFVAYRGAADWLALRGRGRGIAVAALALAVVAARPAWLRPEIPIKVGPMASDTTLAEQRDVADQLQLRTLSKKLLMLGSSELLYLMRYENPLPLIYFNRPARSVYALPGETEHESIGRVALSIDPDAVVLPARRKFGREERLVPAELPHLPGYRGEIIRARTGSYGAIVYSRVGPAGETQ